MGYLGSDLNDYYPEELLEACIKQIKKKEVNKIENILKQFKILSELIKSDFFKQLTDLKKQEKKLEKIKQKMGES